MKNIIAIVMSLVFVTGCTANNTNNKRNIEKYKNMMKEVKSSEGVSVFLEYSLKDYKAEILKLREKNSLLELELGGSWDSKDGCFAFAQDGNILFLKIKKEKIVENIIVGKIEKDELYQTINSINKVIKRGPSDVSILAFGNSRLIIRTKEKICITGISIYNIKKSLLKLLGYIDKKKLSNEFRKKEMKYLESFLAKPTVDIFQKGEWHSATDPFAEVEEETGEKSKTKDSKQKAH